MKLSSAGELDDVEEVQLTEPALSMDISPEVSSAHREISGEVAFAEEIRLPSRGATNQPWRTKDKQAL